MCEGVIQFQANHEYGSLSPRSFESIAAVLSGYRHLLRQLEVVGCNPNRYDGAGFGNLSGRVGAPGSPRGRRGMLITGTQTGARSVLSLDDYCHVRSYDIRTNQVNSTGCVLPSSESLTHASLYDLSPSIRFVFHVHTPALWNQRRRLRLATTPPDVPYGTQQMARSVEDLYRSGRLALPGILAMGGHEDGIITFGRTAQEAGLLLFQYLARAHTPITD